MRSHQTPVTGMKTTVGSSWRRLRHHVESTSDSYQRMRAAERNWVTLARALRPFLEEISSPGVRLKSNYYLERIDEAHRYGAELKRLHPIWLQENRSKSFFDWLDENEALIEENARDGMYYLDSESRGETEARIEENKLVHAAPELLREGLDEVGKRQLIFVVDQADRIYTLPKSVGTLHHSSFLSGARVKMAGTFEVDDDFQIKTVTNYSGHYAVGEKELAAFLSRLTNDGANLDRIALEIHLPKERMRRYMAASEWLANRALDSVLEALQA
jgi:hypothetical protein